jgi:myo-inositol 2-dehydrogenase / D-chiro-inositol 1-dehydrogenase
MRREPVGLAVFGAGRIGAVHVRNAATLAHVALIGVADIDGEAARRLVDKAGKGRVDDVAAFLRDPSVAGVIVATPTASHVDLIELAAAAGKQILCEKPISLDIATTVAAIASAARSDSILQVGFQRRFDEQFLRARSAVESGELGFPRFLRLVGRDHRVPSLAYLKTSGGQFKDQMIHEFDLARWLMAPANVTEVYAVGSTIIEPKLAEFGDADTTAAVLRFDSGALAIIDGSREAVYGYDVRGELHGSKGMVLVGHERLLSGQMLDARTLTPDADSFIERFDLAYRAELADFVDAIAGHRSPRVSGEDALEALRIAEAATRSFRERRPFRMAEVIGG